MSLSSFSFWTILLLFVAILVTLVPYLRNVVSPGPSDSPVFPSKEAASSESNNKQLENFTKIINRELEASISSYWPTTPLSPLCEAWAYLADKGENEELKWKYLDVLIEKTGDDVVCRIDELLRGEDDDNVCGKDDVVCREEYSCEDKKRQWSYEDSVKLALESAAEAYKSLDEEQFDETTELEYNLLHYALSLRAHSPFCELHRTLSRETAIASEIYSPLSSALPTAFVIIHPSGQVIQTPSQLATAISAPHPAHSHHFVLLPNERPRYGSTNTSTAVLYGHVGTTSFRAFYQHLLSSQIPFVIRHMGAIDYEEAPDVKRNSLPTNDTILQGYGVRLDIRNVEYRAFDDKGSEQSYNASQQDFSTAEYLGGVNLNLITSRYSLQDASLIKTELQQIHSFQIQKEQNLPPPWQRRNLPLQTAIAIAQSSDPLQTLKDLSQNLPSRASSLVSLPIPQQFTDAADAISRTPIFNTLPTKAPFAVFVNGRKIPVERPSFNVFELLNVLREEDAILEKMERELNMTPRALEAVQSALEKGEQGLTSTAIYDEDDDDDDDDGGGADDFRIDVGRGGKGAIIYINDIEKDPMYAKLPNQMQAFLFGSPVRRNMFTILMVLDPLNGEMSMALNFVMSLFSSQFAIRVGVVLVKEDDMDEEVTDLKTNPHAALLELFRHVVSKYGSMASLSFLAFLTQTSSRDKKYYTAEDILQIYSDFVAMTGKNELLSKNEARQVLDESDFESYRKSIQFAIGKGIRPGMSFLNGLPLHDEKKGGFEQKAGQILRKEHMFLAQMVSDGSITDDRPRSVYAMLLTGNNVYGRYHLLLTQTGKDKSYIKPFYNDKKNFLAIPDQIHHSTTFLMEAIIDLDSEEGCLTAKAVVDIMSDLPDYFGEQNVKVSFTYGIVPKKHSSEIGKLFCCAGGQIDPKLITRLALAFSRFPDKNGTSLLTFLTNSTEINDDERSTLKHILQDESCSCNSISSLPDRLANHNFLAANGRVLSPIDASLIKDDVNLLISLELQRSKSFTKMLHPHLSQPFELFMGVAKTSAFLGKLFSFPKMSVTRIDVKSQLGTDDDSTQNPLQFIWNQNIAPNNRRHLRVKVTALLDPITEPSQRLSPLLLVIRDNLKLPLTLILAPRDQIGAEDPIPISTYYRFVADPIGPPKAVFRNLPMNHLLTLRMDVPEPWNVQQSYAVQDTDNLRCDIDTGCGDYAYSLSRNMTYDDSTTNITKVEYEMSGLLFFGQCYDMTNNGDPPNGLQLTLTKHGVVSVDASEDVEILPDGTIASAHHALDKRDIYSDTLVMKNLGYWQIRANPGVWELVIAKNSLGSKIFDIVEGREEDGKIVLSKEMMESSSSSKQMKLLVMKDFVNRGEILMLKRREGFENADLLLGDREGDDEDEEDEEKEEEVINVFSLATGHLYERFLKIMMLSVTKRTSAKVKFWLFENFLSPSFKSSATYMAKRINCEIEFVTYKWPEWLRGQSEKQRIIWGYKILFLDVLFPLDVKKIIYVDSDQVVRGDLKELWEYDLNGAPYGYVPFCDSRKETLGYQFWRTGFWETHLKGRPYHISALYVVDLDVFRKELVGDKLRGTYQMLSADPGSLANLDQDLPNYAQHDVEIHSLPQEWLWCESWCSDETKAEAKTIDLCNNPLHKEPKVSMAKRIISGSLFQESWIELDSEVERYEEDFRGEQL